MWGRQYLVRTLFACPYPMLGLVRRSKKEKVGEGQLPGAGGTQASHPHPPAQSCKHSLYNYPIYKYSL